MFNEVENESGQTPEERVEIMNILLAGGVTADQLTLYGFTDEEIATVADNAPFESDFPLDNIPF